MDIKAFIRYLETETKSLKFNPDNTLMKFCIDNGDIGYFNKVETVAKDKRCDVILPLAISHRAFGTYRILTISRFIDVLKSAIKKYGENNVEFKTIYNKGCPDSLEMPHIESVSFTKSNPYAIPFFEGNPEKEIDHEYEICFYY